MTAPAHGENKGQPRRSSVSLDVEEGRRLRNRLRRVEGQLRDLQRMVEEEAPCTDILTQIKSAIAAMEHAGLLIYRHQIEQHVRESLRGGAETHGTLGAAGPHG